MRLASCESLQLLRARSGFDVYSIGWYVFDSTFSLSGPSLYSRPGRCHVWSSGSPRGVDEPTSAETGWRTDRNTRRERFVPSNVRVHSGAGNPRTRPSTRSVSDRQRLAFVKAMVRYRVLDCLVTVQRSKNYVPAGLFLSLPQYVSHR